MTSSTLKTFMKFWVTCFKFWLHPRYIVRICKYSSISYLTGKKVNKGWQQWASGDPKPPLKDNTHMTSMKIVQFSRPPTPLVHLSPKFFHLLDLELSILNEPPRLQMITSQLKGNIIQGWLIYIIRFFLQVGFRFQYQLINLLFI